MEYPYHGVKYTVEGAAHAVPQQHALRLVCMTAFARLCIITDQPVVIEVKKGFKGKVEVRREGVIFLHRGEYVAHEIGSEYVLPITVE